MNALISPRKFSGISLADERFMFGRDIANAERVALSHFIAAIGWRGPHDLSDAAWHPALTDLRARFDAAR